MGREGRKEGLGKKKTLSCSKVSINVSANPTGCSEAGMALRVVCRWDKGPGTYLLYPTVDQSLDVALQEKACDLGQDICLQSRAVLPSSWRSKAFSPEGSG